MIAGWVLLDAPEVKAIVQPHGAQVARRVGRRGGPTGRTMLPDRWSGHHEVTTWLGPPTVRLHPVGRPYVVVRTWDHQTRSYTSWYVNLERPWSPTPLGFDGADLILDVVVSDDCSRWTLKDEDDWSREVGKISAQDHETAHAAAATAIANLEAGTWPFDESGWPPVSTALLGPASLPVDWDRA